MERESENAGNATTSDRPIAVTATYCRTCEHQGQDSKSSPPWYWYCRRVPRLDGYGWVTELSWTDAPPFAYCKDINHGRCPLWEPRKEPKNEPASEAI